MDANQPVENNAALWSVYLREQWEPWLSPLRLGPVGDALVQGAADAMSAWLAFWVREPVTLAFRENVRDVNAFVREGVVEQEPVPDEYLRVAGERPEQPQPEELVLTPETPLRVYVAPPVSRAYTFTAGEFARMLEPAGSR